MPSKEDGTLENGSQQDHDYAEIKSDQKLEYKFVKFCEVKSVESKESIINGQPGNYGIIEGYAATYNNTDRGGDTILPGAFVNTLKRHKRAKRPIRFKSQHWVLMGGWPLSKAKDDPKGLFVVGEINLDVPEGASAYALAKQGVLTDLSIGYSVVDSDTNEKTGVRKLKEVNLWEISLVSEPMDPKANVTGVKKMETEPKEEKEEDGEDDEKGATSFSDLPLADTNTPWSKKNATARLKAFTDSKDKPTKSYKKAFMWFDSANTNNFTAYKLPYADVIDGKLKAVPRAIFAIAAVLKGGRGGVDISDSDKKKAIDHVKKYYKKMNRPSPFKSGFTLLDMDFMTKRDLETLLSNSGLFTNMAATYVAKYFKSGQSEFDKDNLSERRESVESKFKKALVDLKSNINKL